MMPTPPPAETLVIIGAGHAGVHLAFSLRDEGYEGRIVLISAEEHLPYHRPPLSKKLDLSCTSEAMALRAREVYEKAEIELLLNSPVETVETKSQMVTFAHGGTLDFDRLVFATGARARELSKIPGDAIFHSLRNIHDNDRLSKELVKRRKLLIVGGGFVGLELAAAAKEGFDIDVVVLEAGEEVLGRAVSHPTAAFLRQKLEGMGVSVITSAGEAAWTCSSPGMTTAELGDGRRFDADVVVTAIGAAPNTELAKRSGLPVGDGIMVDDCLTVAPNIHAIGDCSSFPHHDGRVVRLESIQNANDQAKYLAKRIVGQGSRPYRKLNWFWSDIGRFKLQIAGLASGSDASVVGPGAGLLKQTVFRFDASDRLTAVETVNQPAVHMMAKRVLQTGPLVSRTNLERCGWQLKRYVPGNAEP